MGGKANTQNPVVSVLFIQMDPLQLEYLGFLV